MFLVRLQDDENLTKVQIEAEINKIKEYIADDEGMGFQLLEVLNFLFSNHTNLIPFFLLDCWYMFPANYWCDQYVGSCRLNPSNTGP
jgi:hypothetical protein